MDMHNIMSKLVTYSTLGLVRDRTKKDRRATSPTTSECENAGSKSCWPLGSSKHAPFQVPEKTRRTLAKASGDVNIISSLQALRGQTGSQYKIGNAIYDVGHLSVLYSPDVVLRRGSLASLSEDYLLAEGLLRTVWIT